MITDLFNNMAVHPMVAFWIGIVLWGCADGLGNIGTTRIEYNEGEEDD